MKIYIVTKSFLCFTDKNVIKVFASRDKAQEFIVANPVGEDEQDWIYNVEEYEVEGA